MNTEVYKDKRNNGKFFHKGTGFNCTKTKKQALLDITEECNNGGFYTQNYLFIESLVLKACACKVQFISINTSLL